VSVPRFQWCDLPAAARDAVEDRFGPVRRAVSAGPGLTPGVAAHLITASGGVFLKAIPLRSPALGHYEAERGVNTALPAGVPAPRLLWSGRAGGWLLLVFRHLAGARHADLTPGSPDIPRVLDTITGLAAALTPCPYPDAPDITGKISGMRRRALQLGVGTAELQHLELGVLRGTTLLHADLHDGNLLVAGGRVHVIDWSLACRGAAWVELALLAPRLVAAGHPPRQVEALLSSAPAWRDAPADAVAALAAVSWAFSTAMAERGPHELRARRRRAADAAAAWLTYRRELSGHL